MLKVAFFVEGQTERIFLRKLIAEIFGLKNISYEIRKSWGGQITTIESIGSTDKTKWHFQIVDCGGDSTVKSTALDNKDSLIKQGYSHIVGLRDVFPIQFKEINNLKKGLYYNVPQKEIKIDFVLCVMEIESWFISECSHFERIHPNLSSGYILSNTGMNPCDDNIELIYNPALALDQIYKLVGLRYNKKEKNASRTINNLNYHSLYFINSMNIKSLNELITHINSYF